MVSVADKNVNMAVRGGLTRFARRYSAHPWASPLRGQRTRCSKTLQAFLCGQSARCVRGPSNKLRPLSNPGRGFSSPQRVPYAKKKPVLAYELFFKYGGEGGIDSLRSPCGQPVHCVRGPSNGLRPLSNPSRGFSSPQHVPYAKKKPVLAYELFFKYGGEGGIRTPDTLPYTHFPGVLLQPLGHLTILLFLNDWNGR